LRPKGCLTNRKSYLWIWDGHEYMRKIFCHAVEMQIIMTVPLIFSLNTNLPLTVG
jgi:hypothetical protein